MNYSGEQMKFEKANPVKYNKGEIPIDEIFHSIQGEADDIGKRVLFIRTPTCNLRCSWCDSMDAVLAKNYTVKTYREIIDVIKNTRVNRVIWTGGEPTLFKKQILDIYRLVRDEFTKEELYLPRFAFETNGTIMPQVDPDADSWEYTISPKLGTSEMSAFLNKDVLLYYIGNKIAQFKFVARNDDDLKAIFELLEEVGFPNQIDQASSSTSSLFLEKFGLPFVTIQPEWYQFEQKYATLDEIIPRYFEFMKEMTENLLQSEDWAKYNWRVLPQMHKMYWGNIKGV